MFNNLVRWWLTGILLLLPFHYRIVKGIELMSNGLSSFINRLDEITIVVFFPLVIREFYRNREIPDRLYFVLLFPILVLSISGLISGMVNGNSLFITALGTFDYIKNFLVIFIYAAFFRDFNELKKVFRILLMLAIFIGAIAIIQELWAMVSRYVLQKDLADTGNYLLGNIPSGLKRGYFKEFWRLGIYRAPSLIGHYNISGLYSLLILTIYLSMAKKVNFAIFNFLFAGVFTSVSRMVYAGFIFIAGFQVFKGRRWLIALICPIAILLFFMFIKPEFLTSQLLNNPGNKTESIHKERVGKRFADYREYARHKALTVWKDHPFWGVGPGMFGGPVAKKYLSPFHEKYGLKTKNWGTLDQFWPQALAELGIIGTAGFAGLLVLIFITLFILSKRAASEEIKGLFIGLATFILAIFIYTFGGSLNIAQILFTYSAFIGMGLGCSYKQTNG